MSDKIKSQYNDRWPRKERQGKLLYNHVGRSVVSFVFACWRVIYFREHLLNVTISTYKCTVFCSRNITPPILEGVFSRVFFENEVFAQCYFHDFRFICSLSLVIIHFRAVLFSRFLSKSRKTRKYNGCEKYPFYSNRKCLQQVCPDRYLSNNNEGVCE